jgi:hypothetical protein
MRPLLPVLLMLSSFASASVPVDDGFEQKVSEARANEQFHARYERTLQRYFAANKDAAAKWGVCLRTHRRQDLRGYFEFGAKDGYRVVLRPAGAFATCMTKAFEGHKLPAPPVRPYLHSLKYQVAPVASAAKPE